MEYQQIKSLKAQVEHVLNIYPETRDSDTELALFVARIFSRDAVEIKDSVARCRRKFNEGGKYLTRNEEIARQRKTNMDEWRVAMGYPMRSGGWKPASIERQEKTHQFPSKTKRGIYYTVKDLGTTMACDCPSYQFHQICKHIKVAVEIERQKLTPALF